MAKFVKVILLLLLAVAFYSVVNDSSAPKAEQQTHAVALSDATQGSLFSQSEHPYLPEGELLGGFTSAHQFAASRIQRVLAFQYSLSLKALVQRMASREAALARKRPISTFVI